jgi:hypothetical protein
VLKVLRPQAVAPVVEVFIDEASDAGGAEVVEEGTEVVGSLVESVGMVVEECQEKFLAVVAVVLEPATKGDSRQL